MKMARDIRDNHGSFAIRMIDRKRFFGLFCLYERGSMLTPVLWAMIAYRFECGSSSISVSIATIKTKIICRAFKNAKEQV